MRLVAHAIGERQRGREGGKEGGRDLDLECVRIGCKKRWRVGGKHYTNSYHISNKKLLASFNHLLGLSLFKLVNML